MYRNAFFASFSPYEKLKHKAPRFKKSRGFIGINDIGRRMRIGALWSIVQKRFSFVLIMLNRRVCNSQNSDQFYGLYLILQWS